MGIRAKSFAATFSGACMPHRRCRGTDLLVVRLDSEKRKLLKTRHLESSRITTHFLAWQFDRAILPVWEVLQRKNLMREKINIFYVYSVLQVSLSHFSRRHRPLSQVVRVLFYLFMCPLYYLRAWHRLAAVLRFKQRPLIRKLESYLIRFQIFVYVQA